MDARRIQLQQSDPLALLADAADDAQRHGFFWLVSVLVEPAQVQRHLTLVRCRALDNLQLHH